MNKNVMLGKIIKENGIWYGIKLLKSKKKSRIDLAGRLLEILSTTEASWLKAKKITKLIANNYRRRQKGAK